MCSSQHEEFINGIEKDKKKNNNLTLLKALLEEEQRPRSPNISSAICTCRNQRASRHVDHKISSLWGSVSYPALREALVKRHRWPANRAVRGNDATQRQYFNLPLVSHTRLGTVTLFRL